MAALLSYAADVESGDLRFAVAADDTTARYVWPAQESPAFGDERVQAIVEAQGAPEDAAGWLGLATQNIGQFNYVTDPINVDSLADAMAEARQVLNRSRAESGNAGAEAPVLGRVREAFDDISADYPGFGEDDEQVDPNAMTNFVLSLIGGVEEGGHNAWIAEAMQNPNPDAPPAGFVAFPGVDYDVRYPEAEPEETAE